MIYFLSAFSIVFTWFWLRTTPDYNKLSFKNILSRCFVSYLVGIGVLTCFHDLIKAV